MNVGKITHRRIICVVTFSLVLFVGSYWTQMAKVMIANEQRLLMNEIVSAEASAIERRLAQSLAATYIVAQGVRHNRANIESFDRYAQEVIDMSGGISNLQLAPGGIIEEIYPLAGNEKAIGHNILQDDNRRQEAKLAIKERRLTLAGPFELMQGGVAIIGRNPIFFTDPNGHDFFWGFASALIYLDKLLSSTELTELEAKGYQYQLSRIQPETRQREIFARSKLAVTDQSYAMAIKVPNSTWQLTMSRNNVEFFWFSLSGYIATGLFALLFGWMANYVLKQPEKLQATVQQKTTELKALAFYDHLTGLANRRLLTEQLNHYFLTTVRYQQSAAFLFLDLDDFKRINDSLGHQAGDELLKIIAQRLTQVCRDSDIVARLGGDEFGVLLLNIQSVRDVSSIAQKLLSAVEQPVFIANKSFTVTTSVGITMLPSDGDNVDTLMSHADLAMYAAKKKGKHNYSFYDESLQIEAQTQFRLEQQLSNAVENDEFILHFQSIVDLNTQQVLMHEALIRWQHPTDGLLRPDQFIDAAEQSGKIIEIGYWGLRQACIALKGISAEHGCYQRIAVNLSPRQFSDPALLDTITDILLEEGIEASVLEVEITESTIMNNINEAEQTLLKLKELGVTIAIDDFGTGYSSFTLLKKLPVDKLKIDRSFTKSIATGITDRAIVKSLIVMAHALQLKVVAEGIETHEQQHIITQLGCDYGQGYFFSQPCSFEQLTNDVTINTDKNVVTEQV